MSNILITFGGHLYDDATRLTVENGPRLGADKVLVYDDKWLTEQDFYRVNSWLWDHHHKRGFGWYAWKPFIILNALSMCLPNDVVMYTDGDCYPIKPFGHLFEECHQSGIKLFRASGHLNYKWTKRDAYIVMGLDDPKYHDKSLRRRCSTILSVREGALADPAVFDGMADVCSQSSSYYI